MLRGDLGRRGLPSPAARLREPLGLGCLAGASQGGLLRVAIPWTAPSGFGDLLTLFTGSYHLYAYNLFYMNIRGNAIERAAAYRSTRPAAAP
jgi:hypothetical protein